jgi:hypothetical protein
MRLSEADVDPMTSRAERARPPLSPGGTPLAHEGKTQGSVIIGVRTQGDQQRLIKSGVVIGAEHYEARLYDNALNQKQCFRCGQWGHKQGACTKIERCLQCAGGHGTRTCTTTTSLCLNCGQKHHGWQKSACSAYKRYRSRFQGSESNSHRGHWRPTVAALRPQNLLGHLLYHRNYPKRAPSAIMGPQPPNGEWDG